ncbi:MAG: TIGR02556 family CRISPR-associated protein [Brevinematia bacterium]
MTEIIYELTKYLPEDEGNEEIQTDDIKADNVISIKFSNKYQYQGIEAEEFESQEKLLFKKIASNIYLTPTIVATGKDARKVVKHIVNSLKKLSNFSNTAFGILRVVKKDETRKVVEDELNLKLKEYSQSGSKKILVSLKVDGRYLAEIPDVKDAVALYFKEGARFGYRDGVCSLCGERKKVSGNNSPYTFYTIDKPGYIASGLDPRNAWKNFPVCFDCRLKLDKAKKFIETHLKFTFARSVKYTLIPAFYTEDVNFGKTVLSVFKEGTKNINLNQKTHEKLNDGERIIKYVAEKYNQDDSFSLNFLFVDKVNSKQDIKLLLRDVYPSRIKLVFDYRAWVNGFVDKIFSLTSHPKNRPEEYYITMENLIDFFTNRYNGSLIDFPFESEFYQIVHKIFVGIPYDEDVLFRIFMLSLLKLFRSGEDKLFYKETLVSYFLYIFIDLCCNGGVVMDIDFSNINTLDDFLNNFKGLSGDPVLKGIFLVGVITQRVIEYQLSNGKNPLLTDLVITKEQLQQIFVKVREKLMQYGILGKKEKLILSEASKYMSLSSDWDLSVNKISYYFSLGLGMKGIVYDFLFFKEKKKKEVGYGHS